MGLEEKVEALRSKLKKCNLCAWECGTNRFKRRGMCNAGAKLKVNSWFPHFGEETVLVGTKGSGTIFLSNCNMKCAYCQNWEISWSGIGKYVSEEEVARAMLSLQEKGCHNINWVSPTHYVPQLVGAWVVAREKGLEIPVVYNTGGYDSLETIRLLEGVVDVYMPDIKYGNNAAGERYSGVKNYFDNARVIVKEMHRQVGDLVVERGVAKKGLLVRHLVLPNNVADSSNVLNFLTQLSKDTFVNIMSQYRPCYRAHEYTKLNRAITRKELQLVMDRARELGLHRFG